MKKSNSEKAGAVLGTFVGLFLALLGLAIVFGVEWCVVVGLVKLITLCFSITFSIKVATGIFLIVLGVQILIIGFGKKEEK